MDVAEVVQIPREGEHNITVTRLTHDTTFGN